MAGISGFGHLALKVQNLEASLAFYRDKLGLKEMTRLLNDRGEAWIVYVRITDTSFLELFPSDHPGRAADAAAVGGQQEVQVPANLITHATAHITPDMLPLVELDQAALDHIIQSVPGGISNVQDIYGLAPLQAGILYHHLATTEGDPYVLQVQFSFNDQAAVDAFIQALHSVIARNDILRTAILWEGLNEPVQVVLRQAALAVEYQEPLDRGVVEGEGLRGAGGLVRADEHGRGPQEPPPSRPRGLRSTLLEIRIDATGRHGFLLDRGPTSITSGRSVS